MPAETDIAPDVGVVQALAGLVVIDLSQYIAGPYATMLMADAGATVIKVESPQGDATRQLEPFVHATDCDVSAFYLRMNRRKLSVVLNLKEAPGRTALATLIRHADVLVENYRAGVLARLGFDADHLADINPRLIYCSVSGFGHTLSPQRDRLAYNTVAEYEAGVFRPGAPAGDPPPGPVGPPVGDMVPALHALTGLLMALYRRSVTGSGAHVDIAMYDSMLSLNELRSSTAILIDSDRQPDGHEYFCPYGVFAVQDGHICLDVTTNRQWHGFCDAIGAPGLTRIEGMDTGPQRAARYDALIREPLQTWLADKTRDQPAQIFTLHGVPVSVLRTPREALLSEQAQARQMRIEVARADALDGKVTVPASPIRIGDLRDAQRPVHRTNESVAPALGAHTRQVLTQIGQLDAETVELVCQSNGVT